MEELLGPVPVGMSTLFRNKCFLLTVTIPSKRATAHYVTMKNDKTASAKDAAAVAITPPYFKDHLRRQIEAGGGCVFEHFEDVPKGKYRNTKLVAAQACSTAKYVQCLAADIKVDIFNKHSSLCSFRIV